MVGPSLKCVDLIRKDGSAVSGLVPVAPSKSEILSVDEHAAILDAATFEDNDRPALDFVFFRRFADGRSSQIAAYVADNTDERLDESALSRLHLQLWLHGTAPLLYVAWPTRIDVLTCARGPDFWSNGQCRFRPAETLLVGALGDAAEVSAELAKRSRFSALRLADGTFWEDPQNANLAHHDKAAHQSLIQAVVETDQALDGERSPVMRRLLLLMVLIKYLEDRQVFPEGWFGRFHKGAKTFFDVLQGAVPDEVERLLAFLERKFNGDIFTLPADGRHRLTSRTLGRFAELVEARTLGSQRYLWEQFSFEHLPVEVISHLYQRFVKAGHGTVYTPPFLASLLLDHVMPFEKLSGDERILDPACGSGVFLVGAFRRLIQVWRARHNWRRPNVEVLKKILRNSIFGIEMDENAVDLTAFSLALAMCDVLKPEVIWADLRLDRLRDANLFKGDFFELLPRGPRPSPAIFETPFDVVVGNPPFESELTAAAKRLDRGAARADRSRGTVPDRQAAYLFLEKAFDLLGSGGQACLIQPSGLLYNRKVAGFRRYMFRNNRIRAVLDFTSIRNLYEKDPKTVAISGGPGSPRVDHCIEHLTFRRTLTVHERICFELDHYDRHRVRQHDAEADFFVWRANLLGGGRLLDMSRRLRSMRTFGEFVAERGWDYGEGFTVGNRKTRAPFLTGKPLLPTSALTTSGIVEEQLGVVTETHFQRPTHEERYTPPLVLVGEQDTLPMAFWDQGFLAFSHKIVGLHSPRPEGPTLRAFYNKVREHHGTYRFCCTLNGSQSLVGKATAILKKDIDTLPYRKDLTELVFSFWEDALRDDVLRYIAAFVRQGQNSELLRNRADVAALEAYTRMFCRMLGTLYKNLRPGKADYANGNGLICQRFYFGTTPLVGPIRERAGQSLEELIFRNQGHLRTVRMFRFYSDNMLLIVKPDRLRYWLRSCAIRDADETLVDLRQQGY